jgi:hypothetical protein
MILCSTPQPTESIDASCFRDMPCGSTNPRSCFPNNVDASRRHQVSPTSPLSRILLHQSSQLSCLCADVGQSLLFACVEVGSGDVVDLGLLGAGSRDESLERLLARQEDLGPESRSWKLRRSGCDRKRRFEARSDRARPAPIAIGARVDPVVVVPALAAMSSMSRVSVTAAAYEHRPTRAPWDVMEPLPRPCGPSGGPAPLATPSATEHTLVSLSTLLIIST